MSCGCGKARAGELCQECEVPVFARNNYFTGKFMAARDFIEEQRYFLGKARRHDEYLHGWGTPPADRVPRQVGSGATGRRRRLLWP